MFTPGSHPHHSNMLLALQLCLPTTELFPDINHERVHCIKFRFIMCDTENVLAVSYVVYTQGGELFAGSYVTR